MLCMYFSVQMCVDVDPYIIKGMHIVCVVKPYESVKKIFAICGRQVSFERCSEESLGHLPFIVSPPTKATPSYHRLACLEGFKRQQTMYFLFNRTKFCCGYVVWMTSTIVLMQITMSATYNENSWQQMMREKNYIYMYTYLFFYLIFHPLSDTFQHTTFI